MYLGADLTKMNNETNRECWSILLDNYCKVAVANVEESLKKKSLTLPLKCPTPLANGYRPEGRYYTRA